MERGAIRAVGLLMRAIVLLLFLTFGAHAQQPNDLDALRAEALAAVNADRTAQGSPALRRDDTLDTIAQSHAGDMLRRDYFAHEAPDGADVRDRFLAAGGSEEVVVGENLARCTGCPAPDRARIREIERGWMGSPGHRANILQDGFDRFGFGIVQRNGRQYAVQTFAGAGADEGEPISAARAASVAVAALKEKGLGVRTNEDLRQALEARADFSERPRLRAIYDAVGAETFGSMGLLTARCGGCGMRITANDVRNFVQQWAEAGRLPENATDLGFVALANGQGGKRAFAVFGTRR